MSIGMTLDEAVAKGKGTERPFKCPSHDDNTASATVNVLKGVWFCHACHAKGKVTGKAAPKLEDLMAMMEPERAVRPIAPTYLELFNWIGPKYWDTRLAPWVTWQLQMGEDPITGDATFPVHTASGVLAGVGRRHVDPESKAKRFLYPPNWSASTSLFGLGGRWAQFPVIALLEGAADAAAVWETGCPGFAVYGSGLHLPQVELVARLGAKLILLGFDKDERGEEAVSRAFKQLGRMAEVRRVHWPDRYKDANETPLTRRRDVLERAVAKADYGGRVLPLWDSHVSQTQQKYQRYLQEAA